MNFDKVDEHEMLRDSVREFFDRELPERGVRVDTGVYEGFEVTPFYDSMIAKVICWGDTRGEAVMRMRRALSEFRVMGVKTNIPFHVKLVDSARFQAGRQERWIMRQRPS